jgi:hypothetical protein
MAGAKTQGPVCGYPNDYLAEEPTMTTENADANTRAKDSKAERIVEGGGPSFRCPEEERQRVDGISSTGGCRKRRSSR